MNYKLKFIKWGFYVYECKWTGEIVFSLSLFNKKYVGSQYNEDKTAVVPYTVRACLIRINIMFNNKEYQISI